MARSLAPAPADVAARVTGCSASELGAALAEVGFDRAARDEVAAEWDGVRRDDRLAAVLARVVASVEAARGAPATPLFIWPDLDEAGPAGRLFYLYVIALCAPGARRYLTSVGVPDDVVDTTFASFVHHAAIHRRKWGTNGVDAGWWQLLALRGELLEIGRLQYHYLVTGVSTLSPVPWYDEEQAAARGAGFRRGDVQFGLHIPEGPGFDPATIDDSLSRARAVLGAVWPSDRRRLASCMSWLLDDALGHYLPATSNILAFQRRFTMVPGGYDDDADTLEFVFRRPGVALEELPQRTTLERAIVARLREGGHWRARTGWFDFDAAT
ncbi:MAG: acyltransferase domain-containing protein [Acidimicrobiales bacterium]